MFFESLPLELKLKFIRKKSINFNFNLNFLIFSSVFLDDPHNNQGGSMSGEGELKNI